MITQRRRLVVVRPHPRGNKGAKKSVRKTAQAAAAGRVSPKVIEWTRSRWVAAGAPEDTEETATTLLDTIRREKFYIPDPVDGEFVPHPDCMLADCDGISFDAGDCDDLSAAYAAALESIGITCAIIGQAFDNEGSITHVLVGVEVRRGVWRYADPTENFPFGHANKPSREYWVSLPGGTTLCDARPSCIRKMQGTPSPRIERIDGDFVGLGVGGPDDPNPEPDNDPQEAEASWLKIAIAGLFGFAIGSLIFSRGRA